MDASNTSRVPDILLERYLADDLSAEQRQLIEVRRQASEEIRRRLTALEQEQEVFLASDPPEAFAHRLVTRLAVEQQEARPAPGRRWWAWILAPSAAVTATVLIAVVYVHLGERSGAVFAPRADSAAEQVQSVAEPALDEAPAAQPASDVAAVAPAKVHAVEPVTVPAPDEAPALGRKAMPTTPRAESRPPKDVREKRKADAEAAPIEREPPRAREGGGAPPAARPAPGALASRAGFLSLVTQPQAVVTIDGKKVGTTPLVKLRLRPGKYELRLRNRKLDIDVRRDIEVEAGEVLKLKLDLRRGTQ